MFITKILPRFSRTISSYNTNFLSSLSLRYFASTDLGKLGEDYHNEMVKKLTKSHESLKISNINLESPLENKNPLTESFQNLTDNVYSKVMNTKIFPKKYLKGVEKKADYSKELEEVNKSMLSMVFMKPTNYSN